jgi:hypothetical protein
VDGFSGCLPATRDHLPECACCGHAFAPPTRGNFDAALASAVAALLLLLPPFLAPLMTITSFGISHPDLAAQRRAGHVERRLRARWQWSCFCSASPFPSSIWR